MWSNHTNKFSSRCFIVSTDTQCPLCLFHSKICSYFISPSRKSLLFLMLWCVIPLMKCDILDKPSWRVVHFKRFDFFIMHSARRPCFQSSMTRFTWCLILSFFFTSLQAIFWLKTFIVKLFYEKYQNHFFAKYEPPCTDIRDNIKRLFD